MNYEELKSLDEVFTSMEEYLSDLKIIPADYETEFEDFALSVRGHLTRLEDDVNLRGHKEICKSDLMSLVRTLDREVKEEAYSDGWVIEEMGPRACFNKIALFFRDPATSKLTSSIGDVIDRITLTDNLGVEVIVELICCGEGKTGKLYRRHDVFYTGTYKD